MIAGQGTIGLEIAEDLADGRLVWANREKMPRAVIVPVSGGGLISGIAVAITALMPETKIIGVEPSWPPMPRVPAQRHPRGFAAEDVARTKADALRVECVGELTFPHIRELVSDIVTVSEDEMLTAIRRLALNARLVAEPGGAAAVAACLFREAGELGLPENDDAPIVAVLSGGNIDPKLLAEVLIPKNQSYTK